METSTEGGAKSPVGWILVGVTLVVVCGIVLWVRMAGAGAAGANGWPAAEQTLEFAGGGRLEVFGARVDKYVDLRPATVKQRWGWLSRLLGKGGAMSSQPSASIATHSSSRGDYLVVNVSRRENGELVECRTEVLGRAALMLEVRLEDADGQAGAQRRFLSNGVVGSHDPAEAEESVAPGPMGTGAADHRAALEAAALGLLVQHRDPVSGWVNMEGPYPTPAELGGRQLFLLVGWQRDQADLEFRAIRADGGVVPFKVRNPAYSKAPLVMAKPLSVPATEVWEGFEARLVSLRRVAAPDSYPILEVEVELGGMSELGMEPEKMVILRMEGATDEWGNEAPLEVRTTANGGVTGFVLPGSSRRAELRLRVDKSPRYPRKVSECVLLGAGEVGAGGKRVKFELLPGAAEFGISEIPDGEVVLGGAAGDAEMPEELQIRYKGNLTEARVGELTGRYGLPTYWRVVFFVDGAEVSSGRPMRAGGSAEGGAMIQLEASLSWCCAGGTLRPGARIQFGITPELLPGELVFPVELPAVEGR
jgi:hypothetical protein